MIDAPRLLADLRKLVTRLEDDLRARCDEDAAVQKTVRDEYDRAKAAERTAQAFAVWRDDLLTQVAVAWVLSCVFVRFLEDNGGLDAPRLSGPPGAADRLRLARDAHTVYFRAHPTHSDREYLHDVFTEVRTLPGLHDLFDPRHNPLWTVGLSADGATELLGFWQKLDPDTGALQHDFTDPAASTRFLGDLYQDLSEKARKKYALLQTPEFVERFILDRTLTPALEEFGFATVRLIDPTCGSGHFLLGAFERLLDCWLKHEPGTNPRVLVQRALDGVYGVDVNPFAVAIARFRLLHAALRASGLQRLRDAPDFKTHLAVGDSLLHGSRKATRGAQLDFDREPLKHVYQTEDADALAQILGREYHAVVGNPPYITPKDPALNAAYRARFDSCHGQYSLGVPFLERFFDLAAPSGYVGTITANSFMKREFGRRLIEELIPQWDLTHVVDTSGAYIPGHGTPTVILFGRNCRPTTQTVRAVMGIRGEPSLPDDPARGAVWTAIMRQIDEPGSQSRFVSVTNLARSTLHQYPWSIGGGGAAELKELLDRTAHHTLHALVEPPIGRAVRIAEEEAFILDTAHARRLRRVPPSQFRGFLFGECIRDWVASASSLVWYPYVPGSAESPMLVHLWPWRATLANRSTFQGIMCDAGLQWYEYMQHTASAYRTPLSITFAFVATHNHFVLDRGGKVFNRTAPVIKLRPDATEDDHEALLGVLNSSVACFWLKQVIGNKGGSGIGRGIQSEAWMERFTFDGKPLAAFPLPGQSPNAISRRLNHLAAKCSSLLPEAVTSIGSRTELVARAESGYRDARAHMISLQEELDWQCYRVYGLLPDDLASESPPPLQLGERAFEIVLARKMAAGELETQWFSRHGSTPVTELPAHWPADYRALVERRIEAIEQNANIALIEQPEYKRRWNTEPWEEQQERALRHWLLDRLEDPRYWPVPRLCSVARLADRVRTDAEFIEVAALYRGRPDFDLTALVRELAEAESVPYLPRLRYTEAGLRKRAVWEEVWAQQRHEDRIDARTRLPATDPQHLTEPEAKALKAKEVGEIPVPPKYTNKDFQRGPYWTLRGKLDVPKERWISYPGAQRDADPTPVLLWAGFDHLQQAEAVAAYYLDAKEREAWPASRLAPLLEGIAGLLPWLHQWHGDTHPEFGVSMASYYEDFVASERRALGVTG